MQTQRNKVVVHFGDHRLGKGFTHDFVPERESFHLHQSVSSGADTILEVKVADLKAVFFVKTFEGNSGYLEKNRFQDVEASALRGLKIKVQFKDGEVIRGFSLGYNKTKKGFFIIPIDPLSNNERIYVVASSAAEVVIGPDAEK